MVMVLYKKQKDTEMQDKTSKRLLPTAIYDGNTNDISGRT